MPVVVPGKSTALQPSEHSFPEFPDLLFGVTVEGTSFFDATDYLQKMQSPASVADFFEQYKAPIASLVDSYGIREDEVCMLAPNKHLIVDGNLVYLFISFVQPEFLAYMCDQMQQLFTTGFCVSDTFIYNLAKTRLSKEVLQEITNGQV